MTVDQIPLPFTAIRPLPPMWPAPTENHDAFTVEGPSANTPREDQPPSAPRWLRIFPSL